jgi:hypothetical protein
MQGPPTSKPVNLEIRAYDALVHEGVLTVTVRKEFDAADLAQDWARKLAISYPGPFKQVMFNLSHCGLVSSTFFAGLLQLHQHFNSDGAHARIRLLFPDPRIVKNLKITTGIPADTRTGVSCSFVVVGQGLSGHASRDFGAMHGFSQSQPSGLQW